MMNFKNSRLPTLFLFFSLVPSTSSLLAVYEIDTKDQKFIELVNLEINAMKFGKRGLACQSLYARLRKAKGKTIIKPMTADPATWLPSDKKGLQSHVEPLDKKPRGAPRPEPTGALFYLNKDDVDPNSVSYRSGKFIKEIALATDLNTGNFMRDGDVREKRILFYVNAWKKVLGFPLVAISGPIPTLEFQIAHQLGLMKSKYLSEFPILDFHVGPYKNKKVTIDLSSYEKFDFYPASLFVGDQYRAIRKKGTFILRVVSDDDKSFSVVFGLDQSSDVKNGYNQKILKNSGRILVEINENGFKFTPL